MGILASYVTRYRFLHMIFVITSLLLSIEGSVIGQGVVPSPTFHILDVGYGATALGMGGAFVAVSNDLSAVYWNPAGLAKLSGLQVSVDYRLDRGGDERIGASTQFGSAAFSNQSFSLSGRQLQAAAFTFAFRKKEFTLVPAFAFQRLSAIASQRELQGLATANYGGFITSTGSFRQEFSKGDDEFTFGVGATITRKILVGGSWSSLGSGLEETLTGNFTDIEPVLKTDENIQKKTTKRDRHGNYFKLAVLADPSLHFSVGGYVRFRYTEDITNTFDGFLATLTLTQYDDKGNVVNVTTRSISDNGVPTLHQAQLKVPTEWSMGASFRPGRSVLIAGSVTYANWSNAAEIALGGRFNQETPYPTGLGEVGKQPSLLQWRSGFQYSFTETGNGAAVRAGYFRDGQPIGTTGERTFFNGFTMGFGYVWRSVSANFAFVRETGDVQLTSESIEPSHLKNQRWIFNIKFSFEPTTSRP